MSWATWPLFTGVRSRCNVFRVKCPGPLVLLVNGVLARCVCCMCGDVGYLAPVHRCSRSACCVACVVFWATWLLFTGVLARCLVLRVRCPGPHGTCSPLCTLSAVCCVCGVLGHLAPVHRCAPSMHCVACAVSWATSLLFTGVHARRVVLHVRCPGPLGSCLAVCMLGALRCVCDALGHLAPVHRCARSVHFVACAVSWATWLLFTGVLTRRYKLRVRCPGPFGPCSPVFTLGVLCCVCGVLSHLAPAHFGHAPRATWLLFTGVLTWCVVLRVRCPAPLGSCAPVFLLSVLCCVCDVLGHLAAVRRVHGRRVVLRVRFPEPVSSCSPVCSLGALCCMCGVLGHLAPVHWCSRSACCVRCAVSWATWLLFTVCTLGVLCCVCGVLATWLLITGVLPQCVALRVRCPGPLGCCSPCARAACCVACAVSWAF